MAAAIAAEAPVSRIVPRPRMPISLLRDAHHLIGGYVFQQLPDAARPHDHDAVRLRARAQAEVQSPVVLAEIPRARDALRPLLEPAGAHLHDGADTVAVALRTGERHLDPMARRSRRFAEQLSRSAEIQQ